ncbi:hypothetical protein [Stutzerimonas balearica]|uniref:hypothetical protein n=2 Tax=Stutzerimonas balearica TaxID=74829 RepID=UPI00190B0824|nr:hypothetical protein [Stutzerimonas balearica]MBD3738157.1 hypothetical protein [Stutzerimonas balearica]MBK3747328.1 hypothetical protein [Stutzerimonas balearica]MBK3825525.1 hypothetical protein [Stutzerimonas balearica]MBK3855216.1 hypothetical protein [Stutzerimonas balearica]
MELNKAVLDCMRQLRRRLRDEQQIEIHLNQPDAIAAMLAACLHSADEQTQALGRQLASLTDNAPRARPAEPPATAGTVRIYRGQRVLA